MAWQIRERAIHQPQQTPIVAAEFDIGGKHSQHAPKRKRRVLAKRTADDTRGHGPSAARGAPLPPARDTSSRYAQASFRRSEERRVGKECRSLCDWSSDVCSSDLTDRRRHARSWAECRPRCALATRSRHKLAICASELSEIGRASCRERV